MSKTEPTTLWFTLEPDGSACWRQRGCPPRTGSLAELASVAAQMRQIVWLLDGRACACHDVTLPPASARLQAQALPFALEDQVLGPLEDLCLAHVRSAPDRYAVTTVERIWLMEGHKRLLAANVFPTAAAPDMLGLPWQEGEWTLLLIGERGWLRCGQSLGFAFEAGAWRIFVAQAAASLGEPGRLMALGLAADTRMDLACEVVFAPAPACLLACATGHSESQPDAGSRKGRWSLLRGQMAAQEGACDLEGRALPDFAPELAGAGEGVDGGQSGRRWLGVVALVLAGLLAHGTFLFWQAARLEDSLVAIRAESESQLRERFPEITRVVDVRAQATQALAVRTAAGTSSDRFLEQLALVGPVLAGMQDKAKLVALDFERDALELRLELRDMASVDGLQRALRAQSIAASTLSVEAGDDVIKLALRVGAAP